MKLAGFRRPRLASGLVNSEVGDWSCRMQIGGQLIQSLKCHHDDGRELSKDSASAAVLSMRHEWRVENRTAIERYIKYGHEQGIFSTRLSAF